jgi:hypothetical protein
MHLIQPAITVRQKPFWLNWINLFWVCKWNKVMSTLAWLKYSTCFFVSVRSQAKVWWCQFHLSHTISVVFDMKMKVIFKAYTTCFIFNCFFYRRNRRRLFVGPVYFLKNWNWSSVKAKRTASSNVIVYDSNRHLLWKIHFSFRFWNVEKQVTMIQRSMW